MPGRIDGVLPRELLVRAGARSLHGFVLAKQEPSVWDTVCSLNYLDLVRQPISRSSVVRRKQPRSFARISLPFFNLTRRAPVHQFIRIFGFQICASSNNKWTVTVLDVTDNAHSMKTCTNISTTSWPTMSVAKATRHSRLSQGCVFSLGLSTSYQGQLPETNLDNPEVGR